MRHSVSHWMILKKVIMNIDFLESDFLESDFLESDFEYCLEI